MSNTDIEPAANSQPTSATGGEGKSSTGSVVDSSERKILRKLDMRILPIAAMFYFLSFLDRANIANARVAGLQRSLHMSNYQFSMALTFTYVPYILAELPSNLLLKVIGPHVLLPFLVISWGTVTTLQGVVSNYAGLLACRVMLGLMEGGLFPGLVLWLTCMFYPRARIQLRISMFFAVSTLTGAFSGLLAAAISKMDGVGKIEGWQWIFILEGIFTVLFGFFSIFFLKQSQSPLEVGWLTPFERHWLNERLQSDGSIAAKGEDDSFRWSEVWKAMSSFHVVLVCMSIFCMGTMSFGFALFEPAIVSGLGDFSPTKVQLLSVPPFALAFVIVILSGYLSDRYSARGLTVIVNSVIALIGFIMYLKSNDPKVRYGSLFLSLPCVNACSPAASAWLANNSAPHVRRATAIAVGFGFASIGGILSTWLLGTLSPGPEYLLATRVFIGFCSAQIVLAIIIVLHLRNQNKAKEGKRRAAGGQVEEPNDLGDKSVHFIYKL